MMKLLGAGVLLVALRAGAFVVMPPTNSAGRVSRIAGSPASQTAALAREGRHVMLSMPVTASVTSDGTEPLPPQSSGGEGRNQAPVASEQLEAEVVASSPSTVFVAGGSGFVGSEICKQLVEAGCTVIGLSRKGAPEKGGEWTKSVKWVKANAVNQDLYRAELRQSDTVISCVGGFGKTDAYMGLINGEANIKLAEAAADAGVKQFVFVSVHDYKAPSFVKRVGYFDGKRRAEKVVGELFGDKGVILKPALIYGERNVKLTGPNGKERTLNVPLQRIGGPLARITGTNVVKKIAESGLPLADVAWTQPLSVEAVGTAAVRCCLDGVENLGSRSKDSGGTAVLRVQDIAQMVA